MRYNGVRRSSRPACQIRIIVQSKLKVYTDISSFQGVRAPVLTTGTFDGVHLGHRKIIQRLSELAASTGGESTVLTFNPHPRIVLYPEDNTLRLLSTLDEKIQLLEDAGVQHLISFYTRFFPSFITRLCA
jgi:riboflavin kinase/FMN adenylyltransferase